MNTAHRTLPIRTQTGSIRRSDGRILTSVEGLAAQSIKLTGHDTDEDAWAYSLRAVFESHARGEERTLGLHEAAVRICHDVADQYSSDSGGVLEAGVVLEEKVDEGGGREAL